MSLKRYRTILALVALIFLGGTLPAETESAQGGFLPKWKVGDRWLLEASYKDLKTEGEPWMAPIKWVFQVRGMKNIHRQDCYVVHAYTQNRSLKMQAILYLSSIDLRPMRVIDIFPTINGMKSKEKDVDPFHQEPLISEESLVPYDLPVFPLVRRSIQQGDSLESYAAPAPKTYTKISQVGGLKFKKSVQQTGKSPDKQRADSLAAYRTGGEMFQVEIFDPRSNDNLVQVWQEGSPWAISTESSARKVRLIPLPTSNSLPSQTGGTK